MKLLSCCLLLSLLLAGSLAAKDYADALAKSILFYDAQRSGQLPANNPIPWRGDSALGDCVVGGWYDAGDHVKFGLPFGAAVDILSWSLVQFKDGYVQAGQLDMMYDMIKWAYDYMLGSWDAANQELVTQIGDGNLDHPFWGRPEDMTMNRPCKKADANTPGSDIAGSYAAGMAAGSIIFRDKGDTAYADQLLNSAKSLFAFAKAHRGPFTNTGGFYGSAEDKDEMCEGAIWLYKATGDSQYLTDATTFGDTSYTWALGWDNKMVECQALLYQETNDAQWRNAVESYFTNNWFQGGGIDYTPCGLAWRDRWGSLRFAATSSLVALVAAELGIQPSTMRQWAVEQINYILGDNNHDGGCYSFEIGYGSKYPLQPHHRAASCPDPPASCAGALDNPGPSPHVLNGGLVGGPDVQDNYQDLRSDYVQNEVALDYNAGFHGALAGILHLQATNNMPTAHNKCPCNQ